MIHSRSARHLFAVGITALALAAVAGVGVAPEPARAAEQPVVVNVNTATLDELQYLPGVGESRAEAILAERKSRGGFKSVDELIEVRGIGPANLERLRPFARTSGKTMAPREASD